MQDPVEKLKENETFQKLDRKFEWSQVVLFGTVILLVAVALGKQLVA